MTAPERSPGDAPAPGSGSGPGSGPDAEAVARLESAVAGLAREVESLRRGMRQTAAAGELKRLANVVRELGETVEAHFAAAQARSFRDRSDAPPSWLALPHKTRTARTTLADLTSWLRGVYLRYADAARTLPECWLWHPDIVEELVWLQQAWLAAYVDDDASIRAAGDWHDRLRPGVVRRISDYAKTCSLENHLPGHASAAPEVPVTDADDAALDAVARWWGEHRTEPGPAPTEDQMLAAAQAARRGRGGAR